MTGNIRFHWLLKSCFLKFLPLLIFLMRLMNMFIGYNREETENILQDLFNFTLSFPVLSTTYCLLLHYKNAKIPSIVKFSYSMYTCLVKAKFCVQSWLLCSAIYIQRIFWLPIYSCSARLRIFPAFDKSKRPYLLNFWCFGRCLHVCTSPVLSM